MSMKKQLFGALPKPLRQAIRSINGSIPVQYRYGTEFRRVYALLQESQWWSREKLEEYQMRQLDKLLKHIYENVPYYRRIFDERGLSPKDIQNFDDLKLLPCLTKDIVRKNLNDLRAKQIPDEDMIYVSTAGSTGIPLGFYIEKRTGPIRMAFEWREFNWMGYSFGDKCVVLRGNVVERKENGQKAWWEYDKGNDYLILSSYDMTEENLCKYVEKIKRFQPKVIRAYPSTIGILARFIKNNDLSINEGNYVKAISTSSEILYPAQRRMIEDVFKCPIFDKYGNCEQVTILGECEKHEGYHDFMEYSYTEILDPDENDTTIEGHIGEIVSTAFTNYATPFIRYKTQDMVEYTNNECSCGRKLPLVKRIEGRLQELIVAENGNLISMAAINMHSDVFDNVEQFRFYQDTPGEVTFRLIKKNSYTEYDTAHILQELQRKMKNQVDIKIDFVEEIPRTGRGKYTFLVQKLPIEFVEDRI